MNEMVADSHLKDKAKGRKNYLIYKEMLMN